MRSWFLSLVLVSLVAACSKPEKAPDTAILSGVITVDGSTDLSGIIVDIRFMGESLFLDVTNIDGFFGGVVRVPQKGVYSMTVSRNDRVLHAADLILAPADTIRITGAIPRLAETFQVTSLENNAWATLMRMNRQFDRIIRIANAGAVSADSVGGLIRQWSDLYWSIRDTYPGTFAAEQGSKNSIDLLIGVDETLLWSRLNSLGDSNTDFATKLSVGAQLMLETKGMKSALDYVDGLKAGTRNKDLKVSADMRRIELYLIDGDAGQALSELATFRKRQSGTQYDQWAEELQYELTNLIPGKSLPAFTLPMGTDSLTTASLRGRPFVIEFVALAGGAYASVYGDMMRLHRRAESKGIRFITVPLDTRQEAFDAFFTGRRQEWTVLPVGAFASSAVADQLRIDRVPIRYLVGSDGLVIGRYFTYDTQALEADLLPLLNIPNL